MHYAWNSHLSLPVYQPIGHGKPSAPSTLVHYMTDYQVAVTIVIARNNQLPATDNHYQALVSQQEWEPAKTILTLCQLSYAQVWFNQWLYQNAWCKNATKCNIFHIVHDVMLFCLHASFACRQKKQSTILYTSYILIILWLYTMPPIIHNIRTLHLNCVIMDWNQAKNIQKEGCGCCTFWRL